MISVGRMGVTLALSLLASAGLAADVVSWAGNTREWNQRLGVTMGRMGCSSAPDACLQRLEGIAAVEGVDRWTIAVKGPAPLIALRATEFSRLSLKDHRLAGIDIDDFVAALKTWNREESRPPSELLMEIARNVRNPNGGLQFGVTVYEDELDAPAILSIPEEARSMIDRVSLYLHYRKNAAYYADYVARARQLFPGAVIWAGSYAYDRIDYLPCGQRELRHCSEAQEEELFRDSLETQLRLLQGGQVAAIEFYPGFFGREGEWHGWGKARICAASRRSACIERTLRMRAKAVDLLERYSLSRPASGASQIESTE